MSPTHKPLNINLKVDAPHNDKLAADTHKINLMVYFMKLRYNH